ncbi:hypothetical protein [Friedmanniella luteola]|uniref:hypothetical protein n=1 Tax=Friedmanniella luteola TaxID=546871 RepID=UPI001E65D5D4|nr:hypothetical protein [Friedmanniella luteola]
MVTETAGPVRAVKAAAADARSSRGLEGRVGVLDARQRVHLGADLADLPGEVGVAA